MDEKIDNKGLNDDEVKELVINNWNITMIKKNLTKLIY